jgi:DNA-binding NarL/FixJ family response regulator
MKMHPYVSFPAGEASSFETIDIGRPGADSNHGNPPAGGVRVRRISLSDRERDVLMGVLNGETNKEIARRLGLSPHTVRDRVKALFHKCGATSRVALAVVVSKGLLIGNQLHL